MSLNNLILTFPNLLTAESAETIRDFSASLDFKKNPSFVFNRKTEENLIDPEVRKSKTCFSKDSALLSFINDEMLKTMNEKQKDKFTFKLARDYVTFIRYDEGDFFDWHTDFEKVRVNHGTNGFKEMHFIYCVQGCLEGGQLLVKVPTVLSVESNKEEEVAPKELPKFLSGDDKMTFGKEAPKEEGGRKVEEARISNAAIVFDKSMEHKGAEVLRGTKIIMTIDLYVMSEARLRGDLTQEEETQLSDLLTGKRQIMSLKGNTKAFEQVCETLSQLGNEHDEVIPFLQLKAEISGDDYNIIGTPDGLLYLHFDNGDREFLHEFRGAPYKTKHWYYTEYGSIMRQHNRFFLKQDQLNALMNNAKKVKVKLHELVDHKDRYLNYHYINLDKEDKLSETETESLKLLGFRSKLREIVENDNSGSAELLLSLIEAFSMSGDDENTGGLEGVPKIPFNPGSAFSGRTKKLTGIPVYFFLPEFEDESWTTKEIGYSYHCNEPSYARSDINYRYGFMRADCTSVQDPFPDCEDEKKDFSFLRRISCFLDSHIEDESDEEVEEEGEEEGDDEEVEEEEVEEEGEEEEDEDDDNCHNEHKSIPLLLNGGCLLSNETWSLQPHLLREPKESKEPKDNDSSGSDTN